jgi:hypothetical protein
MGFKTNLVFKKTNYFYSVASRTERGERERERGSEREKTKVRSFELLCSINDFFRSKKVNYINRKEEGK